MQANLLTEAVIETDRGMQCLPELLAAMARGEVASFPALRPHQRPAWHMFLVQLAVLALGRAAAGAVFNDAVAWRSALRGLTLDFSDDAPWHLVVTDAGKPAFLQPPDPGGLKWSDVDTPDALDMLITSRNHDIKRAIARDATAQDWVFALVSLQTMEGFGGAGNYGIARMNGGSSSRAMIALAPAGPGGRVIDPSAWWRHDVAHLLAMSSATDRPALLWCLPWTDGPGLELGQLDPLFIEVCRRVRLRVGLDGFTAIRATSKAARIAAKEAKGMTGDPWAPVHRGESKTLTLGERDWTYSLLYNLFYSGDWTIPTLAQDLPTDQDAPMVLVAEAFARGNSKTDGFKSRLILVPKAVRKVMFGTQAVDLSAAQVEAIGAVDKALGYGLEIISAEGDLEKLKHNKGVKNVAKARSQPARAALSKVADALFFPALWDKLAAADTDGRAAVHLRFLRDLAGAARAEYARAAPGIPCTGILRPRAEVRGRAALEAGLAKVFREMGEKEVEHV